jgi:lipopolysaccharide transport system permease protein
MQSSADGLPSPLPMAKSDESNATSSKQVVNDRLIVLERGRTERNYWTDLWAYRELFVILAWRDLAVRYKQTVLGLAWAIIRPLLSVIVLTIVFGRLASLPSDGSAPYVVMVYAGTLIWFLISTIFSDASNSLVSGRNLIGKVYFPRLIVPSAYVVVALVDFSVSFVLLLGTAAWLRFWPDWRIIFFPLFVVLAVLASLGPGLYFAVLNVKYRDFRYIVPFLLQFGLYASPIGFSSAAVPEEWRFFYSLNPVVGIVDGFRWCLLRGEAQLYVPGFLLSIGIVALLLIGGTKYFRQSERSFTDIL